MMGGLPRRDLWLLPLVAACTVLGLLAGAEMLARAVWPEQQEDSCELRDAASLHAQPDCHSRVKLAEGPWVDYVTNHCGYRSDQPCGPKREGSLRVAVLGSSISRGYWVSYDQSFAGRMEADLRAACGREVDVQNLATARPAGAPAPVWHMMAERVGEALALQPDAIVTVLAPFDLEQYTALPGAPAVGNSVPRPSLQQAIAAWLRGNVLGASRAVRVAQHFFYLDLTRYIALFLQHGDAADFLRPPFTQAWQLRLRIADDTISRLAAAAGKQKVPVIVVFMPSRVEAALSALGSVPAGIDPFALGQAIAGMAHRSGAEFIDVTQLTRLLPGVANRFYYPVDGHPNGLGHALIASSLEKALVADVPAFDGCHLSQLAGPGGSALPHLTQTSR